MKLAPQIITPFSEEVFADIKRHVTEIRRLFDWPGIPYHDRDASDSDRFNRYFWHNLPLLVKFHHSPELIALASKLAGQDMKPSYVFLSMYGPEGTCPLHADRPQCQFTLDLLVNYEGESSWPIWIESPTSVRNADPNAEPPVLFQGAEPFTLEPGQAVAYSGTFQKHYRNPGSLNGLKKADLAFFHFVPTNWIGNLS